MVLPWRRDIAISKQQGSAEPVNHVFLLTRHPIAVCAKVRLPNSLRMSAHRTRCNARAVIARIVRANRSFFFHGTINAHVFASAG
jgi:hypothetical protein